MKELHVLQETALTRLFGIGLVLAPAMERGLNEQGLTTARAEVIWRLHREGPMNQRQLSERLQCTPRNVTGLVDALEEGGLVERRPHPTDRRAILVTLTSAGERAAREWTDRSAELARGLFAEFDADRLEALIDSLDILLSRLGLPMSDTAARLG